jgi:hypothetical protein
MDCQRNEIDGRKRSARRKICLSATLPPASPIWTERVSNPALRGDRPLTNRLNHGTAKIWIKFNKVNAYERGNRISIPGLVQA